METPFKVGETVMFQNHISPNAPGPHPDALVVIVAAPAWAEGTRWDDKINGGIWVQRPDLPDAQPFRAARNELSPAPSLALASVTDGPCKRYLIRDEFDGTWGETDDYDTAVLALRGLQRGAIAKGYTLRIDDMED